jgi:hypothetical protein
MPRSSVPLAPIVKTDFHRRFIHGGRGLTERKECWGARTTDGAWDFDREESPGTPWIVIHRATRIAVNQQGNLRACRWYVAAGHAEADLKRLQAHDRGEHAAARDTYCGRC